MMNKTIQKCPQPKPDVQPCTSGGRISPIREWLPLLGVGRASRPGFELNTGKLLPAVDKWVRAIRAQGIRSVICLLSPGELGLYCDVPGGLLRQYEHFGLRVASVPVPIDQRPVLTQSDLDAIGQAFHALPKPVVVHCSAGIMRSGAALRHLESLQADTETGSQNKEQHGEILRLIRNSRREFTACAVARGRYGLEDYGRLGGLLRWLPPSQLGRYLDEIDEVRATHLACLPCSLKFLAFCQIFSAGRLPERCEAYQNEFLERRQGWPNDRDFMAEARGAIRSARKAPCNPPTNVRHFHCPAEES